MLASFRRNKKETKKADFVSVKDVCKKYSHVFDGLGKIGDKCEIKVDENCVPIINPSRRIPVSLKD